MYTADGNSGASASSAFRISLLSPGEPDPMPSDCVPSWLAADSFNFLNAHLGHSNLGGVGPDRFADRNILYKKVGTTKAGVPFDMRVENLSPYAVNNAKINTLAASGLAEINLLGPKKGQGLAETFVDLEYCFLEEDTTIPVTLSGFQLTFFDFDQSVRRRACPHCPAHAHTHAHAHAPSCPLRVRSRAHVSTHRSHVPPVHIPYTQTRAHMRKRVHMHTRMCRARLARLARLRCSPLLLGA